MPLSRKAKGGHFIIFQIVDNNNKIFVIQPIAEIYLFNGIFQY